MSRPPDHEPGCSKGRIIRFTAAGPRPLLTRRQLWSCDACRPEKFARKTRHLFDVGQVVVMFALAAEVKILRQRALRRRQGILVILFPHQPERLVITTPAVESALEPMDMVDALVLAQEVVERDGISQLSPNEYWRDDPEGEDQLVLPVTSMSKEQVHRLLVDSGFQWTGKTYTAPGELSLEAMRFRVMETLDETNGVDLEWPSDEL